MTLLADVKWTGKPVGINRKIMKAGAIVMNCKAYNEFKEDLSWAMIRGYQQEVYTGPEIRSMPRMSGPVRKWEGPVMVVIKQHTRFDIDNLTKPVRDAGEMAGVYANDRQVNLIVVHKMPRRDDNLIEIKIWGR